MKRIPQIFSVLLLAGALSTSNALWAKEAKFSKVSSDKSEVATMHKDVSRILSKHVKWQTNSLHFTTEILTSNIHYNYKSILYKQNRENDKANQLHDESELANTRE